VEKKKQKEEEEKNGEDEGKPSEVVASKPQRPKKLQRRLSSESVLNRNNSQLIHLTLERAVVPQGRKLPTKPINEFPGLKTETSRTFEEADLDGLKTTTSTAEEEEEEREPSPPKKSFVPPRSGIALPMFDPSAVKAGLKKSPVKPQPQPEQEKGDEEEESPSPKKPLPMGAKGFALPGMAALGAVKLKKASTSPAKADSDQPAQAAPVDFRAMLKPAKK